MNKPAPCPRLTLSRQSNTEETRVHFKSLLTDLKTKSVAGGHVKRMKNKSPLIKKSSFSLLVNHRHTHTHTHTAWQLFFSIKICVAVPTVHTAQKNWHATHAYVIFVKELNKRIKEWDARQPGTDKQGHSAPTPEKSFEHRWADLSLLLSLSLALISNILFSD